MLHERIIGAPAAFYETMKGTESLQKNHFVSKFQQNPDYAGIPHLGYFFHNFYQVF